MNAKRTPTTFIKCNFCVNNDTDDHQFECLLKDQPPFIVRAANSHQALLTLAKARLRDVKAGHVQDRETEISILERYIAQAEVRS